MNKKKLFFIVTFMMYQQTFSIPVSLTPTAEEQCRSQRIKLRQSQSQLHELQATQMFSHDISDQHIKNQIESVKEDIRGLQRCIDRSSMGKYRRLR